MVNNQLVLFQEVVGHVHGFLQKSAGIAAQVEDQPLGTGRLDLAERGLHVVQLRVGGHHDDAASIPGLLQLVENLETAEIRKANVQQHKIRSFASRVAQSFFAVPGFQRLVSPLLAFLLERPADQLLVVNYEDSFTRHIFYFTTKQKLSQELCAKGAAP